MLIVDDYQPINYTLCQLFEPNHWFIQSATSGKECLKRLEKQTFDLILLDLNLPDTDGLTILEKVKKLYCNTEVIIFSGNIDASRVQKAMELEAFDYIEKGGKLDINVLQSKVNRCYDKVMAKREMKAQQLQEFQELLRNPKHKLTPDDLHELETSCTSNYDYDDPECDDFMQHDSDTKTTQKSSKMIGKSAAIEEVKTKIDKFAPFNIDILIGGENGTGKELVAQELHHKSNRKAYPFIALNCAGLNEELLETELFGHAKGAFTGSAGEKIGLIRAANKGTLFLDEVGEISLKMQAALLRVLETRKVTPVQSTKEFKVDIRIISASNRKMKKGIEDGIIREDFYHRICQARIVVPALKKRKEDIPLLVTHFLEQVAKEYAQNPKIIGEDSLEVLANRIWTGNIRELRNAIRSLALTTKGNIIFKSDVENYFMELETED